MVAPRPLVTAKLRWKIVMLPQPSNLTVGHRDYPHCEECQHHYEQAGQRDSGRKASPEAGWTSYLGFVLERVHGNTKCSLTRDGENYRCCQDTTHLSGDRLNPLLRFAAQHPLQKDGPGQTDFLTL